jgi:sarcosine oxidase subunit alpha
LEGEIVGLEAAVVAGHGKKGTKTRRKKLQALKLAEPLRNSPFIYIGQGKQSFVSFDEEITISALRTAVAVGYQNMELLQRYRHLGLGPSQGKYESAAIALTAQATQQPMSDVGLIVSPSPFSPISLGVLAGGNIPLVRSTPMHAWHSQWRAKMITELGWRRPESYDNPVAEALTVRRSVGLMDVTPLGKLELRGAGVPALLAQLYGEHYDSIAIGRASYGVRCNEDGIALDDAVVAHVAAETWYLTIPPGQEQAVYEYVMSELQASGLTQIEVTNLTDSYAAMNLVGPQARLMLQPLTAIDLSETVLPLMSVRLGTVSGVSVKLLRLGFMGELGYELHVPLEQALALWEQLMAAGVAHGIAPIGLEAQRLLRLERGHFIMGRDTVAWRDPFAADVTWAVQLEQPHVGGRPVLVQQQARRLTHKLVGYQMLNANVVPDEVNLIVKPNLSLPTGFEIIGRVTSAAYSPNLNKSIGLCWLPLERSQVGAEFSVRVRGELYTGRVVALPFKGDE